MNKIVFIKRAGSPISPILIMGAIGFRIAGPLVKGALKLAAAPANGAKKFLGWVPFIGKKISKPVTEVNTGLDGLVNMFNIFSTICIALCLLKIIIWVFRKMKQRKQMAVAEMENARSVSSAPMTVPTKSPQVGTDYNQSMKLF